MKLYYINSKYPENRAIQLQYFIIISLNMTGGGGIKWHEYKLYYKKDIFQYEVSMSSQCQPDSIMDINIKQCNKKITAP